MSALPSPDGVPVREGQTQLQLRRVLADGGEPRLVLVAFSTVAGLVHAMGDEQPWGAIPAAALDEALRGSGAEAVLVDPVLARG